MREPDDGKHPKPTRRILVVDPEPGEVHAADIPQHSEVVFSLLNQGTVFPALGARMGPGIADMIGLGDPLPLHLHLVEGQIAHLDIETILPGVFRGHRLRYLLQVKLRRQDTVLGVGVAAAFAAVSLEPPIPGRLVLAGLLLGGKMLRGRHLDPLVLGQLAEELIEIGPAGLVLGVERNPIDHEDMIHVRNVLVILDLFEQVLDLGAGRLLVGLGDVLEVIMIDDRVVIQPQRDGRIKLRQGGLSGGQLIERDIAGAHPVGEELRRRGRPEAGVRVPGLELVGHEQQPPQGAFRA